MCHQDLRHTRRLTIWRRRQRCLWRNGFDGPKTTIKPNRPIFVLCVIRYMYVRYTLYVCVSYILYVVCMLVLVSLLPYYQWRHNQTQQPRQVCSRRCELPC